MYNKINKNIKNILKNNDTSKLEEILSSKNSEDNTYDILYGTLKYNRPEFYQIIIDSIINGQLLVNYHVLSVFYYFDDEDLMYKFIESDCLTSDQYFDLLKIMITKLRGPLSRIKYISQILKKNINLDNNDGILFEIACERYDHHILELILDNGFEVVYHNKYFIQSVKDLIKHRKIDHLKILIKYGIDLSFINNVEIKVEKNNKNLVNILIDSGVELENIIKLVIIK
ncbi:hypothetical protein ma699 [Moumouvirus australiensis]|uniref:Ankyrin repeat protein n=1 Tax=Moumouvirus australiensis TaxID=2109587 RepID=A0A2P1EMG2_9VIRU|nr:hypothetical protein QKC55_gp205 [Moumouvirus australiensis]AVL95086.1 hypothetical protein ma699 [Moumouvirus australiensis]